MFFLLTSLGSFYIKVNLMTEIEIKKYRHDIKNELNRGGDKTQGGLLHILVLWGHLRDVAKVFIYYGIDPVLDFTDLIMNKATQLKQLWDDIKLVQETRRQNPSDELINFYTKIQDSIVFVKSQDDELGDSVISSKARYDVAKNAKINLSNNMVMSKNHTGLFGLLFMLYSRMLYHKFINQDEKLDDEPLLKDPYLDNNSGTQKN